MAVVVEIPVTSNAVGTHVRVRIATTQNESEPPEDTAQDWRVIATVDNDDLPTTVETSPRQRGTFVWYQAAAYEDGARASDWSTAQVIEVPLLPGLDAASVELPADGPPQEVTWTENAATAGVRVEWSVETGAAEPDYGSSADVDATLGEYEIDEAVPVGDVLHVRLTTWSEFSGGSVAGDQGDTTLLARQRIGDTLDDGSGDSAADFACRVYMDDDLALYVMDDTDYCLMIEAEGD